MNVLVTGGAGYIGSVTAQELIDDGARVVVLDNLSKGHRAAVPAGAAFVHGDLADRRTVDQVMERHRPDGIMHFAAHSLVGESMQQPFRYLRDNVVCGLNLIESAAQHRVSRFILSSTANLFAEPREMPIAEDEVIVPGSPYGESKHMLERVLVWMERIHGMRSMCLRYFNACGATDTHGEDHEPEVHLIPLVLKVALGQRDRITVFGDDYDTPDGTCVRDYIHVQDLARAHVAALRALERGGVSKRYNLGNGRGYSVKQVIETAREITGHPIPMDMGQRRPGDPPVLVASSAAIERDLGWRPRIPALRGMIESAWRWHEKHPRGYRDIEPPGESHGEAW